MKIIAHIFFIGILTMQFSCGDKSSEKVQVMDVNAFDLKLQGTPDKIILDVRTALEYSQGHLPNSMLIDVQQDDFVTQISKLDRTTPVFVYCLSGIRSKRAGTILSENGFKEIYHLDGGTKQWQKEGKQLVN